MAAAGLVRLGGLVRLPYLRRVGGAAFAPCTPFGLHAVTLWAGRAALPTALRSGPVLLLLLVLLWRCYWALDLPPPRYQSRGYGGAAPWSSAVAGSNCGAAALSLWLSAVCPCLVTNQGAFWVMPGLGALLVVRGPGPAARPPMGVCRPASVPPPPPPSVALQMFFGGGRALALSPLLGESLHCLASPDRYWGRCPRAVLCFAVLCCIVSWGCKVTLFGVTYSRVVWGHHEHPPFL